MTKNTMHELNKSQLEKVTGGAVASDPNNMIQDERLAELEQRLKQFMKTKHGQELGLPTDQPNGSFLGGSSLGGGFGNGPFPDPLALQ